MKLLTKTAAALALAGSFAAPALAVDYVLNNGGSAFPTVGNYGTVSLTQNGANVDVSVALDAALNFVTTGNQNSKATFTFNAVGVALSDIVNIADATPVAGEYGVWTPGANSPFGQFTYGIHCLTCGNGGAGQQADPLTFRVLNASVADLTGLSTGGTAAYFAADVINGQGVTGSVGSTVPAIPEPQTYALMLAGLAAIGFMSRRRRQS